MMRRSHYNRTSFTALQVNRIYTITRKIARGEKVKASQFDIIINCIDRVKPDLTFDELYDLCEKYQVKYERLF